MTWTIHFILVIQKFSIKLINECLNIFQINNDNNKFQNLISNYLSSISFNEIMNNSLVHNDPDNSSSEIVKLKNSISNDISIMRTNLLDGFLKAISYNINRKSVKNNFYEFGSVYGYKLNSYTESKRLGIAINGDIVEKSWSNKSFPAQIFYLKNVVVNILSELSGLLKKKGIRKVEDLVGKNINL